MSAADSGIFILNKPAGMTSQQAVTAVKRALGCRKAGHSGTLDPSVTGVLPVFLGSATRLAEYVTEEKKCYTATAKFGAATDTQDASGTVVSTGDPTRLAIDDIRRQLQSFTGDIEQEPPLYSAIKIDGIRAYQLARAGQNVRLPKRYVHVYDLQLLDYKLESDEYAITFSIECSKGTYVRTICHDLGQSLGVPALMSALVRTRSGPFTLDDAHTLEELREYGNALVLPPASAVTRMPRIDLTLAESQRVLHGAAIVVDRSRLNLSAVHAPSENGGLVRMHDETGQLSAIYEWSPSCADQVSLRAKKVIGQARGV